jgi:hypothetical protein
MVWVVARLEPVALVDLARALRAMAATVAIPERAPLAAVGL